MLFKVGKASCKPRSAHVLRRDRELAPGTRYDLSIPTLEEVVGHDFREEVTPPDEIVRYLNALQAAAPERTHLIHYANSWEDRPLFMLVIGSADRIARLDETLAGLRQLADPRGLAQADADRLLADLPVVTALVHGIHGNEISSSGAALAEAYHLLAAQGDKRVDRILDESLVLIDPSENPDGRARFVMQNKSAQARWPDQAPWSAEHDEPWPGGRGNHYMFDIKPPLSGFPLGDKQADAATVNSVFEAEIRSAPEQALWTFKWFKTRPDNNASPYD